MNIETRRKLSKNNRIISDLLQENEKLLRQEGYNPPYRNYVLPSEERIHFPSGYIRTAEELKAKYHLSDIFPNKTACKNVTYALETTDLMNYILNRINIWGIVGINFYKLALVQLVSIIEALILEAANNICCNPSNCGKSSTCKKHFNKREREYVKAALDKLVLIGGISLEAKTVQQIKDVIELRNRIHIRLASGSELEQKDFNLQVYNNTILILQTIDKEIYQNSIPLYGCNSD